MASIQKRDGMWRAQIRRRRHPSESGTFHRNVDAEAWAREREIELTNATRDHHLGAREIRQVLPAHEGRVDPSDRLALHLAQHRLRQEVGNFIQACGIDELLQRCFPLRTLDVGQQVRLEAQGPEVRCWPEGKIDTFEERVLRGIRLCDAESQGGFGMPA